jgi:hypothetical protein
VFVLVGENAVIVSSGELARFDNSQNVKMNGTMQTTAILADRRSGQLAGVVLADFTQQLI